MTLQLLGLFATAAGFDPVFSIAVAVASYQNQYYAILRLDEQSSQQVSQAERKQRAKQLADKVLHNYESLNYLSFTQETVDVWCMEGTPRSYLPMDFWPKEPVATAHVWMGRNSLHTEVFSQDQHIYSLFLEDMQCLEYRWPMGEQPGAYTQYFYDPRSYRLRRGIESHLMCMTGILRQPWLGKLSERPWKQHASRRNIRMSSQPEHWHRLIEGGRWAGNITHEGKSCDVVILDMNGLDRRDFYVVSDRGFLIAWYIIIRNPELHEDKYITLTRYRDINTTPIPASKFEPTREFRRISADWRKLSDAESLAELEEVRGRPLTPAWVAATDTEEKTAE